MRYRIWLVLLAAIFWVGCEPNKPQEEEIRIEVEVDGVRSVYTYDRTISVGQFLEELNIEVSPLDRINPQPFNAISDGMTITIVRVIEEIECRDEDIPIREDTIYRTDLPPGTTQIAEIGETGQVRLCERVFYENGSETSRNFLNSTTLKESKNRIIYVGIEDNLEPVPIEGTLAYISGGQAYLMQNNSTLRRPVTTEGLLDGRVFDLSSDGRQLLFTRQTPDPNDLPFSNELWVILDTAAPNPIRLSITNVLTAAWRPDYPYTFSYSTAIPTESGFQGWDAYNELWIMRIDSQNASIIDGQQVLENNVSGIFATWGTQFAWSPDGSQLAYAKADGIGLVDLENNVFSTYTLSFPHYNPSIADRWVWQPKLSWSRDSQWVVAAVHGRPYSNERPEDSIIFDIGVFRSDNQLVLADVIKRTGMWANPTYSPARVNELGFEDFKIAYLQAREPLTSVSSEYDLVVADRDGSNPRRIFPTSDQPGMRPARQVGEGEYAWSPSGRQIAIVYRGNLYLVDVDSGLAQLITNDGLVSKPVWTR